MREPFQFEWVLFIFLIIISFFLVFPRIEYLWIYLLIPLMILWKAKRGYGLLPITILNWGIAFLLIQVLVTCFFIHDLSISFPHIVGLLFGILWFFSLVGILDSIQKIKIATLIFLIVAGSFIIISFFRLGDDPFLGLISFKEDVLITDQQKDYLFNEKIGNRNDLMTIGLMIVKSQPWTGLGLNQISKLTIIDNVEYYIPNHFLNIAAEVGIPGLTAYLSILLGVGIMIIEIWKKGRDIFLKKIVIVLGVSLFFYLVLGFIFPFPLGAKSGVFYWVLLALVASIYNYEFGEMKGSL